MRPFRPPAQNGGFTLIELLVVIAIIALLIAVLLPALSEAQAVAISAKCLANQHGLGVAMANYEADSMGALPGVQSLWPLSFGTAGPGELGAPAPYNGTTGAWSASVGWVEGQQIYATFTKGQGNSAPGIYTPYTTIGTDAPFTANDTTNAPFSPENPREYCKPCGLGYLAPYISPTGTLDTAQGQLFYCPGTVASFGPFGTGPAGAGISVYYECAYFSERTGFGDGGGLYSTFLADWNKMPGQSSVNVGTVSNPVKNPEVFSTYIYRSGRYYDSIDTNGHVTSNGQVDTWHSCNSNDTDGYPKADAPYLNGKCYMVCDSEIAGVYPSAYTGYNIYGYGAGTVWQDNICHRGQSVNRAFHDGSARSHKVPTGHLPPYAVSSIIEYWMAPDSEVYAPPMQEVTNWAYGYYVWPYYWAVLDGPGLYSENP